MTIPTKPKTAKRTILFRGKDKANGKWVTGSLEIPLLSQHNSRTYIYGHSYSQYSSSEVQPQTVGQYVGIRDHDNCRIFEGDILAKDTYWPVYVAFEDAHFILIPCDPVQRNNRRRYPLTKDRVEGWSIAGNIYDNPDMLTDAKG